MQAIVVAANPDERDFAAYVLRRAGLAVAPGNGLRQVADNWLENPVDLVVVVSDDAKALAADLAVLRAVTETPAIVLAENPGPVAQYRGGKQATLGFLVGQVMKKSGGQAVPQVVQALLRAELDGAFDRWRGAGAAP